MKKWIAIIGSPRSGQNTDTLVDYVIKGLNQHDIAVKKIYLKSRNLNLCNACEYCILTGVCNINDEISLILEDMQNADGIILASPSYNYNVTSQMKVLLDRTFALNDYTNGNWSSRLIKGKKGIIIGTCKGKTKMSMGYTIEAMEKSIDELGVEIIDIIEYYNTKFIPVCNNKTIKEELIERVSEYKNF